MRGNRWEVPWAGWRKDRRAAGGRKTGVAFSFLASLAPTPLPPDSSLSHQSTCSAGVSINSDTQKASQTYSKHARRPHVCLALAWALGTQSGSCLVPPSRNSQARRGGRLRGSTVWLAQWQKKAQGDSGGQGSRRASWRRWPLSYSLKSG